jgi:hypothetical protein
MSVQAIAGVSPTLESRIMTEFPSIGATTLGRLIGQLLDSVPAKICGVKLSYLIFGLPLAPLGLLLFLLNRLGSRYILTNRSVQIWSTMGSQRTSSVDLNDIASVELDELPGQSFFRAADIDSRRPAARPLWCCQASLMPEHSRMQFAALFSLADWFSPHLRR